RSSSSGKSAISTRLRGYPRTLVGERRGLLESWRTSQNKGVREHGADWTTAAAIPIGPDGRTMGNCSAAAAASPDAARRNAAPSRYAGRARHVTLSEPDRMPVGDV